MEAAEKFPLLISLLLFLRKLNLQYFLIFILFLSSPNTSQMYTLIIANLAEPEFGSRESELGNS